MFKSQIAITLRHMTRLKGYTAINILGLAVGMVCAILIFLYVDFELSYDRYHENAGRIYRVAVNNDARTPPALAPALQEDFPEITRYVRLLPTTGTWIMKHEQNIYYENRVYWADNALFDIFDFPLVQGDPPDSPRCAFDRGNQRRYGPKVLRRNRSDGQDDYRR